MVIEQNMAFCGDQKQGTLDNAHASADHAWLVSASATSLTQHLGKYSSLRLLGCVADCVCVCVQTCAVLSPSVPTARSCALSMPAQALAFAQMPKVANSAFLEVSCTQPWLSWQSSYCLQQGCTSLQQGCTSQDLCCLSV